MASAAGVIPTDREAFVARFGSVVEHSPWVADQAFDDGPFGSAAEVHAAMATRLMAAPREAQLTVLNAHPELAAERAIPRESLTAESRSEQAGAGLDRLSDERRVALAAQLDAYRRRFGFPFIVCVREHGSSALEGLVHERVVNDPEAELATALAEVSAIAYHRIVDLVEGEA
ncbi:MAG: 2-oxo-4-hydroxy-4-carboxy-5-ureidoimidazoline decarboxylase [Solirubrobacteraceae bacterium]|nr:2-oxo-4-hydroxy-4-carboxy-5-ureidoimidazoline decarboxylase [Solirubrobacteraceae bacterium]